MARVNFRNMLTLLALVAVIALIVVLGAPYVERGLMYQPSGGRVAPKAIGLESVSEVILTRPGGVEVLAWHARARDDKPTVLYFHGNGGSLAARADRIRVFTNAGYGIFMMSYRGYSGSTGKPSESNNVGDATAAYEAALQTVPSENDIVIYGESLGTGVAIQVAAANPSAGLILDAPYTSIVDVATRCYPYLPTRLLMRDRYESMAFIDKIDVPTLVIHGERDNVIPVEMGKAVAAAIKGDVELATFPDAGHTDHHAYGSMDTVVNWLERKTSAEATPMRATGTGD